MCKKDTFSCGGRGRFCIAKSGQCDGFTDCAINNADESHCGNLNVSLVLSKFVEMKFFLTKIVPERKIYKSGLHSLVGLNVHGSGGGISIKTF